jgi:ribosomal-protein-alanine N-acetyltransferase
VPSDLDPLLAIAAASPEAASWSRADYEQFLQEAYPGVCLVAELEGRIVGFICFLIASDEAELLILAVLPSERRRGVASLLLDEAIRQSLKQGAQRMFLEVRDTNHAAIGFYQRHGFRISSRRRGYYMAPPADALVLARDLAPEPSS